MGREDLLKATIEDLDGVAILTLEGEIDLESAPVLSENLQLLASKGPGHVIIDASQVSFMDSTGIHALVEGKRALHEVGASIVLVPSRIMRRVLELVFPAPLFALRVDSMEEALAAVGKSAGDNGSRSGQAGGRGGT